MCCQYQFLSWVNRGHRFMLKFSITRIVSHDKPRRPRIIIPDIPLHIIQHGNNRQACFLRRKTTCFTSTGYKNTPTILVAWYKKWFPLFEQSSLSFKWILCSLHGLCSSLQLSTSLLAFSYKKISNTNLLLITRVRTIFAHIFGLFFSLFHTCG